MKKMKKLITVALLCFVALANYGQNINLKITNNSANTVYLRAFAETGCNTGVYSPSSMYMITSGNSVSIPYIYTQTQSQWIHVQYVTPTLFSPNYGFNPTNCTTVNYFGVVPAPPGGVTWNTASWVTIN